MSSAPANQKSLSVAVVGSGAAGLVTTRELLREGHRVTTFEQNNNVGGIWDYQEACETEDLLGRDPKRRHVHSSMYSTLRTNLPRQIMSFSDFPFVPEVMGDKSHDSRRFPSHTEVQAWLEVFAARYDLRRHIQFNSRVTSLRPIPPTITSSNSDAPAAVDTAPMWKLTTQKSSPPAVSPQHTTQQATHTCSADDTSRANTDPVGSPAVVAQASPAEASTTEPALHMSPQGTAWLSNSQHGAHDQNVTNSASHQPSAASVEAPPTGCSRPSYFEHTSACQTEDASRDPLSGCTDRHASEQSHYEFDAVVVCVGNYHQPNLPDVKGIDDFPGLQMHAHNYRSAAMFTTQTVIVVGASFSGEELARAVADVATHVYHSARSFEKSTARGNITRVVMLTQLAPDGTATFQDSTQVQNIDAVIYCTGYQYAYPFLEGTGLITSHDMRVDPLWQHIFPPSVAPTLAFVGLAWKSIRNQQFELQAKLVARALSGRPILPSHNQMLQDIADFYQLLIDNGVPVRYTHNQTDSMPINQWVYNAKLAQLCGPDVAAQPEWVRMLYSATSANILGSPDSFRDVWGKKELAAFELADQHCDQTLLRLA